MRYTLSRRVNVNDVADFLRDIDLSPYGLLEAGSTGVVWDLDDDVLTIKLDQPVEGFGDKFSVMSDNSDVLGSISFYHQRSRWGRPLRTAASVVLIIAAWEWLEMVAAPAVAQALPDAVFAMFDGLL